MKEELPQKTPFHFVPTDKISLIGRSGCGKSYLGKEILALYPRAIIFDSLYEYGDLGNVHHSFESFSEDLLKNQKSDKFRTVVQFDIESANTSTEFDEMMRISYYRGQVMIFIDEVQNFSTVHLLPTWLRQVVLTGRHQGIGLIYTTQRPGELHKTLLSQSSKIFCGNLHSQNDIKTMSNYLDRPSEEISNLPDRKFIFWTPGQKSIIIDNKIS